MSLSFWSNTAPQVVRRPIGIAVELLAGIPSIVYGMWGLFVFAPFFAQYVQLPLMTWAPAGSIWEKIFAGVPNGANILTASIIVAIMILPYMAAVLRDLLLTVPPQLRESGYGMGSTSLEVVMAISLPFVRRSAIGAIMLGLGRALGETMAVTFIIGNSHDFPTSLFASGSTIASTIANEFNEATSDMHSAALIALGLVLFVITFAVLAIARLLLGTDKESRAMASPAQNPPHRRRRDLHRLLLVRGDCRPAGAGRHPLVPAGSGRRRHQPQCFHHD